MRVFVAVVISVCVAACGMREPDPPEVAQTLAGPLKIEADLPLDSWSLAQLQSVCDTRMGRRFYILRTTNAVSMYAVSEGCE